MSTAAGLSWGPEVSAAPDERLPDLAMAFPSQLRVEVSPSGVKRLRFTTMIVNIGAGPFETGSSRQPGAAVMGVNQRIYNSAGQVRKADTSAVAMYSGDGHDHWHVQDVAHYELFDVSGQGSALRRDAKVGFCFFDTSGYRRTLPRSPKTRKYPKAGCGTQASLFVRNGISVGWADKYAWNLSRQWITLSGIPAGQYFLKVTVDPLGQFQELNRENNCNWMRIRIYRISKSVPILERGSSCQLPGAPPAGV